MVMRDSESEPGACGSEGQQAQRRSAVAAAHAVTAHRPGIRRFHGKVGFDVLAAIEQQQRNGTSGSLRLGGREAWNISLLPVTASATYSRPCRW